MDITNHDTPMLKEGNELESGRISNTIVITLMKKQITKTSRDLEYNIWTVRLSEDNIDWLKEQRLSFGSWNLLFNDIKEQYENGGCNL